MLNVSIVRVNHLIWGIGE